jgi:multidrug resistance efflux pump
MDTYTPERAEPQAVTQGVELAQLDDERYLLAVESARATVEQLQLEKSVGVLPSK